MMPSYLTVMLDRDKAILTAQEAMAISVAFPYARGRHQEPLSERILTNDLYGIPLYQPSVGLIELGQTAGELRQPLLSSGTPGLTQTLSRIRSSGGQRNPDATKWPSDLMSTQAQCAMCAEQRIAGPSGLPGSRSTPKRNWYATGTPFTWQ